jgi:hypothetical protein
MADLTLLEASKSQSDAKLKAAQQIYAETYHPLTQLPFVPAQPGGVLSWTVEDTLATIASRAIGADYTPDNGRDKPYAAVAAIYGGKVQIDRVTAGTNPASVPNKKANKIRSFARKFTVDMFEGQGGSDLKGVSKWIADDYSGQAIDGSAAVLTMAKMDALYDKLNVVPGRSFFYMTQTPFLALNTLSRTPATGAQAIQYMVDTGNLMGFGFGARIAMYNDVPIVVLKDNKGNDILSTAETTAGVHTGGTATSVYGVTYGPEMFTGFEALPFIRRDFVDNTNFESFLIEHVAGVAPKVFRSVARLYNVKNSLT